MRKLLFIIFIITLCVTGCATKSAGNIETKVYTVNFEGPGGHSNGAYGNVNAVHAASRSIIELTKATKIKFTIVDFKGGNSVNSIAFDAHYRVYVKGNSAELAEFDNSLSESLVKGVKAENDFRKISQGQIVNGGRVDVRYTLSVE